MVKNPLEIYCSRCPKQSSTCFYGIAGIEPYVEPCMGLRAMKQLYDYKEWILKTRKEYKDDKDISRHLNSKLKCVNNILNTVEADIINKHKVIK